MNFLSNVGSGFSKAIDFVVEKNRRIALINRVKVVIRNEEENSQRAYVALGKYYYRNLRDEANSETEIFCSAIENANNRRDRALQKLDDLLAPQEEPEYDEDDEDEDEDEYGMCDECCDCCDSYCEEDLKKLDGAEDDEDEDETTAKILHPDLAWHDEKTDEKEAADGDEAADDSFSKTIPTDEP
jgi:hypothetical protein